MIQETKYSSLTDMARRAPITRETVAQFRDQALQTVDGAIDTFFRPEREVSEGKASYDKMTDLERALRVYQGRVQDDTQKLSDDFNQKLQSFSQREQRTDVGQTDSLLPNGKPLTRGFRETSSGASLSGPYRNDRPSTKSEVEVLKKITQQMSEVLPLYGSVAMVPGPLSASLKDTIKQSLQWSTKGSSISQSSVEKETLRLLTASYSKESGGSRGSSTMSSSGKAETLTADERIMPGMHQIRQSIAGLGFQPGQEMGYVANKEVTEYERVTETTGAWFWKDTYTEDHRINQGSIKLEEGSLPYLPDRIRSFNVAGNEGLTKPGAGAELVDLVRKAELSPEFLDEFRGQAQGMIDNAIATLFNPQREVGNGRIAYEQLTNLSRALQLADARWHDHGGYGENTLAGQAKQLDDVTPLYACVAMVPGQMSSSIKNHAKEIFDASLQASSVRESYGKKEGISGLGLLGLSDEQTSSFEASDLSSHFRQESFTTDERIMPKLHSVRVQLDNLVIHNERGTSSLGLRREARSW